ncbi:SixA phosphatase family protein [Rhodoplanes sp. Z2-YC6860]|uniref:SixA phosphatase family protein n=1 Tax=Rhodoplanes sp. Z2-YC6860 TaxID=674703 RepID=UPI00078D7F65|nr:histidine phosphatase family protein [Rhodoplanes sp. Z2-YC6860]AMN43327.1 Phosphohistidine phosphatase SixA [Rhodoplanes sp. Z2-YC6860]
MRRLLLLRHAKAERLQSGGRDHDRILAKRGREDAAAVGAYLVRHKLIPDLALVSTSARTRETWGLVAKIFPKVPPAEFEGTIYEAEPEAILDAVRATEPEVRTLLVVGHNPGMQQLAGILIASGEVEARQRLLEEFPTSAFATISFATGSWDGLHANGGRLEHFVTPQTLEATTD